MDINEFYKTADKFRSKKVWWIEDNHWCKDNIWGKPKKYEKGYLL